MSTEGLGVMVFNATFNNISAISWWSVLLVPAENHRSSWSHCQTHVSSITAISMTYFEIMHRFYLFLQYLYWLSVLYRQWYVVLFILLCMYDSATSYGCNVIGETIFLYNEDGWKLSSRNVPPLSTVHNKKSLKIPTE